MSDRSALPKPARALPALFLIAMLGLASGMAPAFDERGSRGLGRAADEAMIATQDYAIGPRGEELPAGRGGVAQGAELYAQHCAMCHGAHGHEGPDPMLVGGQGSLASSAPQLTVGSYWPYATTVYDYINRAMPFASPGSLSADAVYALTAFLLHANGIIAAGTILDRTNLPAVVMPNRNGFVGDPRPDLPTDKSATRREREGK